MYVRTHATFSRKDNTRRLAWFHVRARPELLSSSSFGNKILSSNTDLQPLVVVVKKNVVRLIVSAARRKNTTGTGTGRGTAEEEAVAHGQLAHLICHGEPH